MNVLNEKCARLRHELQQAYDAWMGVSERQARRAEHGAPVDISGSPEAARTQWFDYLAAKERLVLAYAERPLAA